MNFSWAYVAEIAPQMLRAAVTTVEITFLSMLLALVLGLLVALARASRIRPISWVATVYVELLRSLPVLIQIYYAFFVLPVFGITLDTFLVGVLVLGVYYSTYTSEVYRAGLEAVPPGQWEAAVALNLAPLRTLQRIILPQAVPAVIAPLGNYLIEMFKATPLLATIGLAELLGKGQQLAADTFRYSEVYLWIGVVFLALSYPSALLVRWAEKRTSLSRRIAGSLELDKPVV